MGVCKYCGREHQSVAKSVCGTCQPKMAPAKRFAEVRDDLRERLGLERLGDSK